MNTRLVLALVCVGIVFGKPASAAAATVSDANRQRPLMLISDVDDTIKRTNVLSKAGVLLNGPRTTNPFGAMPSLYNAWYCDPLRFRKNELTRCMNHQEPTRPTNRLMAYVTGAPWKLQAFARGFLKNSGFPEGLFFGRDFGSDQDVLVSEVQAEELFGLPATLEFKIEAITALMKEHRDYDFVLVGDNGEKDVLAYDAVKKWAAKMLPRATVHTFIHQVYNYREGVKPKDDQAIYVTAGDLALELHRIGVLSEEALVHVINQTFLAMQVDEGSVFPKFMDCRHIAEPARLPQIPTGVSASTAARAQKLIGILKGQCSSR